MRRRLTNVLLAALLVTCGAAALGGRVDERRLDYETVKTAIEQGEARLVVGLLAELVAAAETEPERLLYQALAARSNGEDDLFETRVEQALAVAGDDDGEAAPPEWVRLELLALASARRLERLKRANEADLKAVLERHYEALGGLEHLDRLQSFVAVGELTIEDRSLPFRLLRRRPFFYRLELSTPAGLRIEAADPQAAWRSDPTIDDGRPSYLSPEVGAALQRGAHFSGPLVRYRLTGEALYYRGLEALAGRKQHVIEVIGDGGAGERIYLDSTTMLETRRVVFGPGERTVAEVTTELLLLDDYHLPARQTVAGPAGTVVYDYEDYRLNVEIDLRVFDIDGGYSGTTILEARPRPTPE